MSAERSDRPEFSRVFDLTELSDGGETLSLSATPSECEALSRRFGLLSVDRLDVRMALTWLERNQALKIEGSLDAVVLQTCVVSLEPVRSPVRETLQLLLARDPRNGKSVFGHEEADPLEGHMLDLGELAAEELALGLDPYPRSPNIDPAMFELGPSVTLFTEERPAPSADRINPFRGLAGLKGKL